MFLATEKMDFWQVHVGRTLLDVGQRFLALLESSPMPTRPVARLLTTWQMVYSAGCYRESTGRLGRIRISALGIFARFDR